VPDSALSPSRRYTQAAVTLPATPFRVSVRDAHLPATTVFESLKTRADP
jgi:hypothetical protein